MATVNGSHQIVVALQQHGQDMEREVADEMAGLAQRAVRLMQRLAPKSRSTLWTSIAAHQNSEFDYEIRPGVDYSYYAEKGVKPGGKGLPRFFDPASASIVDWLKSHPAGGGKPKRQRAPAFGSKAFQAAMLDLRDRYEGLAWHVRHHGVKAQPFVEPTAKEMEPVVLQRLNLAVRRVLAARPDASGSAA
ncbi:HK97 gp10 family phage protein [Polaromonas sp. P2-4]|nr:HK97 gp10 family phage protein [Polaromonas sp. P2-4]